MIETRYMRFPVFALLMAAILSLYGSIVSAHTQTGSLGNDAGVADIYLVSCTTSDTANARLEVSVINVTGGSPLLSVMVERNGVSQSATDAVSGDSAYSPLASVTQGNGSYTVTLSKAGAGTLNYSMEFHCKTAAGLHTGDDTSIVIVQNEGSTTTPTPPPSNNNVFEPTEVKDEAMESSSHYTGLIVGQGCEDEFKSAAPLPVKVVRALFPNATDANAFIVAADGTETLINNLDSFIQGANGGLITLAPGMIQDKNIFKKQFEVYDANGGARAIEFRSGKLDVTAAGILPFRVSTPAFIEGSCAKKLLIRLAVANYCHNSRSTDKDNRADIWIGHATARFNDTGVLPHDSATDPYWPTLVVHRDLIAKPLGPSCGDGLDIAVQPSDNDIDAYLPTNGYWPN